MTIFNNFNANVLETFPLPVNNAIGFLENQPNPAAGIPFSQIGADWGNYITAELMNVQSLSGITPQVANTAVECNDIATSIQILQTGGLNSAYHNETNVRTFSSQIINTHPKPIYVKVAATSTATASINATIGGVTLPNPTETTGTILITDFIVPPNGDYSVTVSAGTPTLVSWIELF
jgi:hypothetical protein